MATKRKKRRHRGAAGKANADLTAHIRSLGLTGVAQYQTWCRDHGLNRALNKGWQARRRERAIAERAIDAELTERELLQHIRELGLKTVADYADAPPVPNPRYVLCPTCAVLIRDSDRFGRKCLLQNRLKKILGLCAGVPNFSFELTA